MDVRKYHARTGHLPTKCRMCSCIITQEEAERGDAIVEGMGCETLCQECAKVVLAGEETQ